MALLQPVDVGGVTVSRATLYNADQIRKRDLREGDKVRVARAGDVIPEVVERIERPNKNAHKFHISEHCPSCETKVIPEGAYVICPADLRCPAQLRERLQHYGSREALDIIYLGKKTVEQLVDRDMVTSMVNLYRLKPEEFEKLDLFGKKTHGSCICFASAGERNSTAFAVLTIGNKNRASGEVYIILTNRCKLALAHCRLKS